MEKAFPWARRALVLLCEQATGDLVDYWSRARTSTGHLVQSQTQKDGMNIGVFTFYTPSFQALADVTLPNIRRYCDRHGYDLMAHCGGEFGASEMLIGLRKTGMACSLLPLFDALFVIDIDVLITNHTIRLESFLDDEHIFFVAHDDNHGLNAGAYIIRNAGNGKAFLRHVLAEPLEPGECEQDAMRKVLAQPLFTGFCKVLPHPSINSYLYSEYRQIKSHEEGQWQPGDFVLHLPGMTNERRIEIFTSEQVQGAIIE